MPRSLHLVNKWVLNITQPLKPLLFEDYWIAWMKPSIQGEGAKVYAKGKVMLPNYLPRTTIVLQQLHAERDAANR